jgi:hypothetical protein
VAHFLSLFLPFYLFIYLFIFTFRYSPLFSTFCFQTHCCYSADVLQLSLQTMTKRKDKAFNSMEELAAYVDSRIKQFFLAIEVLANKIIRWEIGMP